LDRSAKFQTEGQSNLRNEEPHTLYCLSDAIIMIRLREMECSKAVALQAWSGSEGSRKLRFPNYMTMAQDGGKVVSITHRPPLPPGNVLGTHFC
jgi:hypothetical protein